jgi:hypothetical protein
MNIDKVFLFPNGRGYRASENTVRTMADRIDKF